ncbi:MFS transporter [Desulfuribacillus stibiiarsenatis]|uniref:MFS transporter n=1 Tax=Desulfuribacillus stibiiarsenatis TaxID=1390249 RepID=A0A1E5L5A5_9FIRM|nr:MFS transporter [Desulfuribacillus stibiiarsenatis]OEH85149.1 MFS transporter [Desulfuribacillus stibiiarsenatis]
MQTNEQVNDSYSNWQKNTILFLSSQTISLFGSALVQFSILWYITLTTESGLMMTMYIICGFLPTFFLSPIAGVWADRYNRKNLIIMADALIATATLILAIVFLLGYGTTWLLFLMASIRAVGTGIQTPAVGAILPQIVPADNLTKVNGINGSIHAIVNLLAPMASAVLLSIATLEAIFFIDVITAVIAIFTLLFLLKIPVHAKALQEQTTSYFKDLQLGINYIRQHAFLKKFFVFFAVFFVLIAPAAFLTPLQVTRSFGSDVWRLTAIEIAFSIGMMLGGFVMAFWGGFKNKIHTMTLGCMIFGLCTFALGIIPNFWIYLLFMSIIGVAIPLFNTPSTVLLQEKVEEEYLGRVFGVLGMISTSMMPLGMLVFGPLADVLKIEWLLIGSGILLFLQGFMLVGSKTLVKAGEKQL